MTEIKIKPEIIFVLREILGKCFHRESMSKSKTYITPNQTDLL